MRTERMEEDEYLTNLVDITEERSTCIRRGVASIALDRHRRVIGMGFNGVPRNQPHCLAVACPGATDNAGNTSQCLAIHAEQNLIVNTPRTDEIVEIWTSATPCKSCAQLLTGLPNLRRLVAREEYSDPLGLKIMEKLISDRHGIMIVLGKGKFLRATEWHDLNFYLKSRPGITIRDLIDQTP